MSGILIVHRSLPGRLLQAIIDEQGAAGFPICLDHAGDHWRAIGFAPLLTHMPAAAFKDGHGGFALANGSFFFRGRHGQAALELALQAWRDKGFDRDEAHGNYSLLLGQGERFELFRDHLPSQLVYTNRSRTLFSTLLLPVLQSEPQLTLHVQGVYEYAWLHANHGQQTPFEQVTSLAPDQTVRFSGDRAELHTVSMPDWATPDMRQRSEDDIAAHYASTVKDLLNEPVRAFGDRIRAALSGGYDSRLIAAALSSNASQPSYYVYGAPGSADRRVAEHIARQIGLRLDAIEKPSAMQYHGGEYTAHIDRKAVAFDGLYLEGLFDNGVDLDDRAERLRDTDVLISGSGGEALRNFFYLPDRRYSPSQVVDTFWSSCDPAACTEAFDEKGFREAVAAQLAQNIGAEPGEKLSRQQAELAYPLFRVRYWTIREIAVNQRFGWCYYPYLHADLIKGTAGIPLRWKNHGRLEGRLIKALSPELAALKSDYGFSFDQPIPWRYRLKMQTTYQRPTWLRRYSYRLQMRARPAVGWPDAQLLSNWMDPALPRMSELFQVDRIKDPQTFNRVATVEYLLERHRRFRESLSQD